MSFKFTFTKDNVDQYLKELAKEFRKLNGKNTSAELILIGGASILINYGFREMTYDMDAIIQATSTMKEAINHVGDKFSLPIGWLNSDFTKTKSFSPKLISCSKYYKTFSNIITVRTIAAEYLIAMKLMSGRKYKNDLSDVVGVLLEHHLKGRPISMQQIDSAICYLYSNWDKIPEYSKQFINAVMESDYETLYHQYRTEEQFSREILLDFVEQYPRAATERNINDILETIKVKKGSENNSIPPTK